MRALYDNLNLELICYWEEAKCKSQCHWMVERRSYNICLFKVRLHFLLPCYLWKGQSQCQNDSK